MTEEKVTDARIIARRIKRMMSVHRDRATLASIETFWNDLEHLVTISDKG